MKKEHINAIIYISVFSIAYGGFYYQRYTAVAAASVSQGMSQSPANTTLQVTLQQRIPVNNAQNTTQNFDNSLTRNPDIKSTYRDGGNTPFVDKTKTASITTSTDMANTYITPLPSSKQVTYSLAGKNIRKVSQSFTSNAIFASVQNNITESISNNIKTNTAIDQSITVSDGSEFLPDGSSQQDLFVSQSKNPKVYTIKDYQTADISCNAGYRSTSPRAVLMRGLKGC